MLEIGEMVISAFIGLVGLGPATFHLLDSLLTTTTKMSICPHMTSYSNKRMEETCVRTLCSRGKSYRRSRTRVLAIRLSKSEACSRFRQVINSFLFHHITSFGPLRLLPSTNRSTPQSVFSVFSVFSGFSGVRGSGIFFRTLSPIVDSWALIGQKP